MSTIDLGIYVGETTGNEYVVEQYDHMLTANDFDTDVNLETYKTKCGLILENPDSAGRLYSADLKEFLVKN